MPPGDRKSYQDALIEDAAKLVDQVEAHVRWKRPPSEFDVAEQYEARVARKVALIVALMGAKVPWLLP